MKYIHKSKKELKIANIVFKEIRIDDKSLLFKMEIGSKSFSETISFKSNTYLYSANLKGLICHIYIMDLSYTLFITSSLLDQLLSKYNLNNEFEKFPFSCYDGVWFIEFVKTFNDNIIYFMRSIDDNPNDRNLNNSHKDENIIFKGFFHTSPKDIVAIKKFILFEFFASYSILTELKDVWVSGRRIEYSNWEIFTRRHGMHCLYSSS